jgi:RNA polymerase sigma-70 factor, ECF subfamily
VTVTFITDAERSTVTLGTSDISGRKAASDALFSGIVRDYGAQISRFAMGYELDVAKRHELRQEMLLAVWQSLAVFEQQCGLRTWVYRVTHNVGVSHIQREKRRPSTVSLDDETLDLAPVASDESESARAIERSIDIARLLRVIDALGLPDRQIMVLYLEELDAASIADVVGLSAVNVATKIHRIKALLARQLDTERA